MNDSFEIILYPLFVLLFTAEEFDQELIDLMWWGMEGIQNTDCSSPSSHLQFKKLALKIGSIINPVNMMNNF